MTTLSRRQVLARTTAGSLALPFLMHSRLLSRDQGGAVPADAQDGEELPFRISLAQWSLHRALRAKGDGALDNLDFAKAARGFGIDAIEYVNHFFKGKVKNREYLTEMKKRAADHGVRSLLIMCDGLGRLGDPEDAARAATVEAHRPWLAAAKFLGCHSIRVNAASAGSYEEQQKLAADGLAKLTEHGKELGLNVIVENHGGLSSNGKWLSGVMKLVDDPRCGTLPDFGNFRVSKDEVYDRYTGVKELMPFAKAVSAKSHDFDDDGNEKHTDYARMLGIVLDAGYHGHVGIEYEGSGMSEPDGIRATLRLLERVRAERIAASKPSRDEPVHAADGAKKR
ncbi:MAG: TIM barrel protein [Planctomycetes bacterium]|nr:TIM barrel protein [Planctomycetota bacterium]